MCIRDSNVGDGDTAYTGGGVWEDPRLSAAVKRFVYSGGGFIGVGEPAGHQYQGRYLQLGNLLGVEEERGFTLGRDKYNWEEHPHFITEDCVGEIDFGEMCIRDRFFDKATHYEEGIWDTPEAKTCFDIVTKLASYTEPTTPAQAHDQDFTKNQQLVLDNKALFMPNGTWIVGEMAKAPRADGFKWGMTALPAVEAGGDGYSYTWFEQAWIPAGAANPDAAKQFVAFLYSDKACEIFAKAGAIPVSYTHLDVYKRQVKKFQKQFSLTADGVVGRATWYKISYIYASVKKLAELTSEGEEPSGQPSSGTYPGAALREGSTGASVRQIQFWLSTVSGYVASVPDVAVDGVVGPSTTASVKAYQKHVGLVDDGVVGRATWDRLYADYQSIEGDISDSDINFPGKYPGTLQQVGSRGNRCV